ncbi:hypothetical protein ACTGJ9_029565 [Bradyrhizobium sp. RDM12]
MSVRFQAQRQKVPLERVEVGVSFRHGSQGKRIPSSAPWCLKEILTRSSAHSCWKPRTSVR